MGLASVTARFTSARWRAAWAAATWLFKQGRSRLNENLSEKERSQLWELMRKSKGRRSNLSSREQNRFRDLVKQGALGRR